MICFVNVKSATTFHVNCFTITVVHMLIHLEVKVKKLRTQINYNHIIQIGSVL